MVAKFKVPILIMAMIIDQIHNKCAFTVDSLESVPRIPDDDESFIYTPQACPFYKNTNVCCNSAIDATFGYPGGGCDFCSANLKRFWCEYACNPFQKNFLEIVGNSSVPDPSDRSRNLTVQELFITVGSSAACDLWSSCKRTQFASQVSAMQSPAGFFGFQGENGILQAKQYIKTRFSEDPEVSVNLLKMSLCNAKATNFTIVERFGENVTVYTDPYDFEIVQNCSCNNCDLSCSKDVILYEPTGVMEGFSNILVFSVWGVVLGATLLVTIVRLVLRKKQERKMQNLVVNQEGSSSMQQTLNQPLLQQQA